MENTEKEMEDRAWFDVLGAAMDIKDRTDRAEAVLRAGRMPRHAETGTEYPPELTAYRHRVEEEAERRMANIAHSTGADMETVRRMCRNPAITFQVLDDIARGKEKRTGT